MKMCRVRSLSAIMWIRSERPAWDPGKLVDQFALPKSNSGPHCIPIFEISLRIQAVIFSLREGYDHLSAILNTRASALRFVELSVILENRHTRACIWARQDHKKIIFAPLPIFAACSLCHVTAQPASVTQLQQHTMWSRLPVQIGSELFASRACHTPIEEFGLAESATQRSLVRPWTAR